MNTAVSVLWFHHGNKSFPQLLLQKERELNCPARLSLSQPRRVTSVYSSLFKINGMAVLKAKSSDKSVCPGRRGSM